MKITQGISEQEKKIFTKMALLKLHFVETSYNFAMQQAHGLPYLISDYTDYLYPNPEDKEKRIELNQRESVYYLTNNIGGIFLSGIFCALEKQYRDEPETFDPSVINLIKTSMMGPLAGLGDSVYSLVWRMICASIGLTFLAQGNPFGMILYVFLVFVPRAFLNYYLVFAGYKLGTTALNEAVEGGVIKHITGAATILGLMMVGAMIASSVGVPLNLILYSEGEAIFDVGSSLDSIMPGLLPLALTLLVVALYKKKVNPTIMIIALIALGILGALIGIF